MSWIAASVVSAVIMTGTCGHARSAFGVEACLWASVAGFALQFLMLFTSPVLRLDRQPEPA
jgi:hypothetical protein